MQNWTFGRKLASAFSAVVALAVLSGAVSVYALRTAVEAKDAVIRENAQKLIDAQKLSTAIERKVSASRGFLLSTAERFVTSYREADVESARAIEAIRRTADTAEERSRLDRVERAMSAYDDVTRRTWEERRSSEDLQRIGDAFERDVLPARDVLRREIDALVVLEERLMESGRRTASDEAASAMSVVIAIVIALSLLSLSIAFVLTRTLGRQIGGAVGNVRSSSTELQAAANQQATSAKEQSTAMREITTTITELLATSRQIAESAQRVAQMSSQTRAGAQAGQHTVERSNESLTAIRAQVDLIVAHMLELGRKSQQIGSIVDIVSELAEQTNILAINATIEAAGAGETGRRFAVVADEIRKLADRVTGSAKEIRALIEDVRGSVNTTVMATETGSKTVDAGTREFGDLSTTFGRIADLVSTTSEAAREIELSTKQQATAVEQVNLAIGNVATATRESEASAAQTLETASQLSGLSRDLLRLVEPEVAA
jgi:methyl-accepting chemotaxis protein